MKTKYCVGFFLGIFLFMSLMGIGAQIGYQYIQNRQIAYPIREIEKSGPSLLAEGNAVKNEGFYLREQNGCLVVYLADNENIYEYTNIQVEELPSDMQEMVRDGMYVKTIKQLFGILENYTS